jgi:hypothetical protein
LVDKSLGCCACDKCRGNDNIRGGILSAEDMINHSIIKWSIIMANIIMVQSFKVTTVVLSAFAIVRIFEMGLDYWVQCLFAIMIMITAWYVIVKAYIGMPYIFVRQFNEAVKRKI